MAKPALPPLVIFTPRMWGARPPRFGPVLVGRPQLGIFHHTDGHAPLHPPSQPGRPYELAQAFEYARLIQHIHMDVNGWGDSGHNFLVMRSGVVLVGRWGSLSAIRAGRMVESAHCPGENWEPGIEHEHLPGEEMTPAQREASARLWAYICAHTGIRPTRLWPHRRYYNTACPSNLITEIPLIRARAAAILTDHARPRRARARALVMAVGGGRMALE